MDVNQIIYGDELYVINNVYCVRVFGEECELSKLIKKCSENSELKSFHTCCLDQSTKLMECVGNILLFPSLSSLTSMWFTRLTSASLDVILIQE